jgi:hypothetical protein
MDELVEMSEPGAEELFKHAYDVIHETKNPRAASESIGRIASVYKQSDNGGDRPQATYNMIAIGDEQADKITKALADIRRVKEVDTIEGTEK